MMRRTIVLLGVLALAACAPAADPDVTEAPEATVEATAEEPTPEDPTTPEPTTPEPTTLDCDVRDADGPRAETIYAVPMPDGTVVSMVQEVDDLEEPVTDVVVYLCSGPLDEEAHRTVATDIAVALHESPEGEGIGELQVGVWVPGDDGPQRVLEVEDFGAYTWDRSAARAPESVWEA